MPKKKIRLIARLDVKDVNLVKGIQLEGLRKLGDPNKFAREYYEQGIDELLYIDIVASLYNRNNLSDIVRRTVDDVYIPVCVGGGLRSVEDVRHILSMGADKVAINTAAIKRPELITEVANAFGSQCMVLSIQAKRSRTWPGKWEAYYDNGRAHSGYDVVEWAKRGVELGAGEILLAAARARPCFRPFPPAPRPARLGPFWRRGGADQQAGGDSGRPGAGSARCGRFPGRHGGPGPPGPDGTHPQKGRGGDPASGHLPGYADAL